MPRPRARISAARKAGDRGVFEPLEPRLLLSSGPDLAASFGSVLLNGGDAFSATAVPGDRLSVELRAENQGDQATDGELYGDLFLSLDQSLDEGADVQLMTEDYGWLHFDVGQTNSDTATVTLPEDLEPGTYFLILRIRPDAGIGDVDDANNVVAGAQALSVKWMFGEFDGRKVRLEVMDGDGTGVRLSLKGGVGELVPDGSGGMDVVVTGTHSTSSLTAKADKDGDGSFSIGDLSVDSSIKSIKLQGVQVLGDVDIQGGIAKLSMGDLSSGGAHTIQIGSSADISATSIQMARVKNLTSLTSQTMLKSLTVTEWLDDDASADVLTAPALKKLAVKGNKKLGIAGDFQADVILTGDPLAAKTLSSAKIAGTLEQATRYVVGPAGKISVGAAGSNWAGNFTGMLDGFRAKGNATGLLTAASIKSFGVSGNLTDAFVYAGTNFGTDAAFGGTGAAADTFGPGYIGKFSVAGQMTRSTVLAGVHPFDENLHDINDMILGGSASYIKSLKIGAVMDADSRIDAGLLPRKFQVNRAAVDHRIDARFGQKQFAFTDAGETDANGRVTLDVAGSPQTFEFRSRLTDRPLVGGGVTVAVDAATRTFGVLVVVDPSERLGVQVVVLDGSSVAAQPLAGNAPPAGLGAVEPPALAEDPPSPTVVHLSNTSTQIVTSLTTSKLTTLVLPAGTGLQQEVLGTVASGVVSLLGMTMQLAETVSGGKFSEYLLGQGVGKTQLMTPEQALQDVKGSAVDNATGTAIVLTMTRAINPLAAVGVAMDLGSSTVARQAIGIADGLPIGIRATTIGPFTIYTTAPIPLADQLATAGLVSVHVPGADEMAKGGSLSVVQTGDLGLAYTLPLDAGGDASVDVPAGEYIGVVDGPGYVPGQVDLSVVQAGTVDVNVTVEKYQEILAWSVSVRVTAAGRKRAYSGTVSIAAGGGSASFGSNGATITVTVAGNTLSLSGSGVGSGINGVASGSASGSAAIQETALLYTASGSVGGTAHIVGDDGVEFDVPITGSFSATALKDIW